MKNRRLLMAVFMVLCLASAAYVTAKDAQGKKRLLVVSSYHREYPWTQGTNKGLCAALLKFGYFDNQEQTDEYTGNDYVETSKVILKKLWMDAKRKNSPEELAKTTAELTIIAKDFKPDLILLGDDDAAQYIGSQFLDARIPIVFWGINNTPVKYGLVDRANRPGHNVTGVYQSGYYVESLELLKRIVPGVKTFAVLSDGTSAGRLHYKAIEYLSRQGSLPIAFVETVATNDYEIWKTKALELRKKVDAFFIAHYAGLKDKQGNHVRSEDVAQWYLTHISLPEVAEERLFVEQGILCAADDSAYKQGFEAIVIAHDILAKGAKPATYPPRAPKRGALIANTQRAGMLGIKLTKEMGIEEFIEEASALKNSTR